MIFSAVFSCLIAQVTFKFPCKICENIANSNQAIQCDLCNSWVHIKCNDLNYTDYKFLQNSNSLMILSFVAHTVAEFFHSVL